MSNSAAATTTETNTALMVPPSYIIAQSAEDTDIDDLAPGVDWISASGKEGRFLDEEKQNIGEELRVVFLHAAPGQTAWPPKDPEKADQVPHPDLEWFKAQGIPQGRPFCKNRDVKRLPPQLSDDVTPAQLQALRTRGYTGDCKGCPFKRWAPGAGPVCRETREALMRVKGRDLPGRLTIDGTSLSPLKSFFKKEFKGKVTVDGKERWVDFLLHSRAVRLGFKRENNEHGGHFVLTFDAQEGFLPHEQVAEFGELREAYLAYSAEYSAPALPPQEEHADYEVPAEPVRTPAPATAPDGPPPPSDADAPPVTASEKGRFDDNPAQAVKGFF